jgi:aspartate/methionine/tyrosine aminotransferase
MTAPRPSGIRAVFERALELERGGRSIVHLEIGRPHADSPPAAKAAAAAALAAGHVHYTPNRGLPALREALAARQGRDPAEILVTAGGSEAVAATMLALVEAGDEVVVCDPAWPHYDGDIRLAAATPVHVSARAADGFAPDPDAVAAAVTPQTRMLVLCSPSNPTGGVLDAARLEALAAICRERDLWVLSDEIYEAFVYDGAEHRSIAALAGMAERTIVSNSFSKTWSMTGWRVGWLAAPAAVCDRINPVHQHLAVCAPSFAQEGALAALQDGPAFPQALVAEYAQRRAELLDGLAALPGVELAGAPAGAFYAFPAVAGPTPAVRMLEEAGVAAVPGEVFGDAYAGHVRLSYAVAASELRDALERLRALLGSTLST